MRSASLLSVLLSLAIIPVFAQEPLGIFDDHQDIGDPIEFGIATYDESSGRYAVEGGGETIGDESFVDQFHFVFKQVSGSFAIEAIPVPDVGGLGGVMIRQDLDPDSVHASFLMTSAEAVPDGNADLGSVYPTFRTAKGGGTIRDGDPSPAGYTPTHTGKVRLERFGNTIYFYTFNEAGNKVLIQEEIVPMGDTVFAGLAVTAESSAGIGYFEFEEVAIEEFPLAVFRTLPTEEYQPQASLSPVTVTARVRQGQTADATVHEVIPDGATISNVQASAGNVTTNPDGSVDWQITGLSGEATLTYDLVLGESHSAVWRGTFSDGVNPESYIGGDTILPKYPTFTPLGPFKVDPVLPVLIQAEWGTVIGDQDFGIFIDPRTRGGITVVAMDGFQADTSLDFELIIPEDGTYYFFGNVRSEDGNSDSFHADVDWIPAGDNSSRWNISSRKAFAHEWLSSDTPALDPRPFELPAGQYPLHIACREDSTSIDWIVVTNNPDINPTAYVEGSRALVTRNIPKMLLEVGVTQSQVELTGYVAEGVTQKAIVHEVPPAGFSIADLSASDGTATLAPDGTITWDLTGVTGKQATLQYQVTAPAGTTGVFRFSGSTVVGSDIPIATSGDFVLALPKEPTGKTVYFFRRVGANNPTDLLLIAYFQAVFGLKVVEFDDTNAPGYEMPADLSGADMVYCSETVSSGNVRDMDYHLFSPVPMIHGEAYLGDDFTFQPGEGYGTEAGTELEIIDNTHPIMEGFSLGVLKVWDEDLPMGHLDNPPDGVRVLAIAPGNPNRARLWVFEKGATANGQTTPGLRIGTWLQTDGFAALNSDGVRLVNQIFAYALGEEPPTAIEDFELY